MITLWVIGFVVLLGALAYFRAPGWIWVALGAAFVVGVTLGGGSPALNGTLWTILVVASALVLVPPLRRALLSDPLLGLFRKALPHVSQTEQEALDAGTVWWDGDLFSGNPDWNKLLAFPKPTLSAEERAFVDGTVDEVCAMLDDWKITHELLDLPPHVWQFIKDKGFLGMIIPKQFGGLGFSALAHSEVVTKLTTRSGTAAVSVMVPLRPLRIIYFHSVKRFKNETV